MKFVEAFDVVRNIWPALNELLQKGRNKIDRRLAVLVFVVAVYIRYPNILTLK